VTLDQAFPAAEHGAHDGHSREQTARAEAVGEQRADEVACLAASSASGKLIQPWCTATPEKISVTSLGIGMHALSGTISRKTPSAPKLVMKDVTRSLYPVLGSA
jgi:hypothetical protein